MMFLKDILAKSNPRETLRKHTENVIRIWLELKSRYFDIIPDEKFWELSFLAIAFHDFGKICDQFQYILKGEKSTYNDERIRHEFFSGMFLLLNNLKFYQKNIESLAAVFSHHKAFNDEGFIEHIQRNVNISFRIEENIIGEFVSFVNYEASLNNIEGFKVTEKNLINSSYKELLIAFKRGFYDKISEEFFLDSKNRNTYIYHKAILNIADWTASGDLSLEKGVQYSETFLEDKIISKLREDGKTEIANNFKFRDFQKESLTDNNVIAIAPTGSGKTEAALLWASSKKDWERIIYLLPTRVTSNAIYNRLSEYFGYENTQLIHSSARQYIKEQLDDDYDQRRYFRDKSFFKNINICTVDQLLTLGFNLGFWEVKTFHMLNARIIIDEIHLYSPYTLGLIISTIKYLKENFNASFYIMTATLPEKLKEILQKTLGSYQLIQDRELLNQARNQFEIRNSLLQDNLEEIKKAILEREKVLIVVNTVDQAIELFEVLKPIAEKAGVKAVCYHSRFIKIDRFKKEQEIFDLDGENYGGLLIATQVVEVSLDIDFDVLFTENAPIDAIIQRAGRVNRKRRKNNSKVVIFKHSNISREYVYNLPNILENTFNEFKKNNEKRLTESQLLHLVDVVYEDIDIEFDEKYKEGLSKHLDIQIAQYFIKDLTTDEKVFTREGLDTISVIPSKFEEHLSLIQRKESLSDSDYKDLFSNHEVSIRRTKLHYHKSNKGSFGFVFLTCEYDDITGLKFIEKDRNVGNTF